MPTGLKSDLIQRPSPEEYPEFYRGYIALVPDGDVVSFLETQAKAFIAFLQELSAEDLSYAYGPAKWTIGQVIGHILDVERIMAYRILRISRGDQTPIPGFEENDYVANSNHDARTVDSFLGEFDALRKANMILVANLSSKQSALTGVANGKPISVRALVYILAGHLSHHRNVLRERYSR